MPDGRVGYGPTWMGQRRYAPRPELLKVKFHGSASAADLSSLREILVRGGMMARNAAVIEE